MIRLLIEKHRGKDSGEEWSLIVDSVGVLFVIVAITGLRLWAWLRAREMPGVAWPSWPSAWGWDWRGAVCVPG